MGSIIFAIFAFIAIAGGGIKYKTGEKVAFYSFYIYLLG